MKKKSTFCLSACRLLVLVWAMLLAGADVIMADNLARAQQPDPAIGEAGQASVVRGVVVDAKGGPIIGASVIVKDGQAGTTSGIGGNFELPALPDATLIVSYIGFFTREVNVGGQSSLRIVLDEKARSLDEIVVVGYGVQKKVNLTGSVSNIRMDEIVESRPINNISQGLAGLAAGVQVTSSSNRPGANNATIMVRGQGTLNNSSPLVIIDGVESDINSVNPQDIESMSILKDAASASIYGSRAANGVILITTRQGREGAIKVDYNGYVTWETISNTFDLVSNYAEHMELINEGMINTNKVPVFSQGIIDEWRAGTDPLLYPNTDLMEALFQTNIGTNHNISVSGGSRDTRFYTSFGYLDSPGIMQNVGYTQYSMRTNLEADAKPWLTVGTNLSGYMGMTEPGSSVAGTVQEDELSVFLYGTVTTPGMVFQAPDGRFGGMNNSEDAAQSANNNPLWRLYFRDGTDIRRNIKSRFYATLKPVEGLSVTGSFNYTFTDRAIDQKPVLIDKWNFLSDTDVPSFPDNRKTSIMNSDYKVENYLMDAVATYTNNFCRLHYSVMAGASQELFRYKWFKVTRDDLVDPDLSVINGATGLSSSEGNTVEWVMRSYFGRVNLNWDEKYLLEFNLRADGSSRFTKENRWGYFPSASAAWRIDREPFMESVVDWGLDNLKLRLSYGELGNNALSSGNANTENNYLAQALYGISNYVLNNSVVMGVAQLVISNSGLTWERTKVADVGLDFTLLRNRLYGTVDYFHKTTDNILINLPIPLVNGNAATPRQNAGTVVNRGVEVSLGWQDRVRDFSYYVNTNFTFLKNEVTKFRGDVRSLSGADMIQEGYAINTQFGYVVDRLVQTQEDLDYVQAFVDNSPSSNPFAVTGGKIPQQGDLMYKDLNGDGVVDDQDRTVIGNGPTPKFAFGVTLGAAYRGFDFSMLIQGATGMEVFLLDNLFRSEIRYGYQINQKIADGRWYEGRTDATYPRLLEYSDTRNSVISDFWVQDKSYVKIKNIQLGYTLPGRLTSRVSIDRVRVYVSLENYFTFTGYEGLDPEVTGFAYPTSKQAVMGINVTF